MRIVRNIKIGLILATSCFQISGLKAEVKATELERIYSSEEEKEVSPNEDLMQEHGVLNRLLLIYEEIIIRLKQEKEFSAEALLQAASIMKSFIEDHHEKMEEAFIFPQFEKRNYLIDLMQTLRQQHQAGRALTDYILLNTNDLTTLEKRQIMIQKLETFIAMYRPHEAREDTVVFPALRALLTEDEYEELAEEIEKAEHELFGEEDFDAIVEQVANIEKMLGIYELSQYTPIGS